MINFGGEECISDYNESEISILPVPYDATSTWIKGSEKGPAAIMEASVNLEFYDIETGADIRSRGIFTLDPLINFETPFDMVNGVRTSVKQILSEKRFPVVIGGNHSVSIGAIQAVGSMVNNLTILQLDAHSDLREEYNGSPLNHACSMARAREVAPIVQVGIRSMDLEEIPSADMSRIFFAHLLHDKPELYNSALDKLTENVYVTIDLDVFDPSIMPSTGTPEPGGLLWYEVMKFLKKIAASRNIVGFDVVELCPLPNMHAPDFLASKLVYQFLSYIFSK